MIERTIFGDDMNKQNKYLSSILIVISLANPLYTQTNKKISKGGIKVSKPVDGFYLNMYPGLDIPKEIQLVLINQVQGKLELEQSYVLYYKNFNQLKTWLLDVLNKKKIAYTDMAQTDEQSAILRMQSLELNSMEEVSTKYDRFIEVIQKCTKDPYANEDFISGMENLADLHLLALELNDKARREYAQAESITHDISIIRSWKRNQP